MDHDQEPFPDHLGCSYTAGHNYYWVTYLLHLLKNCNKFYFNEYFTLCDTYGANKVTDS